MRQENIERLLQVVTLKGWTQERLAKEIHSSRQTINRWLTGKVPPTRNSLSRVATATGCDLEWLLTGKGEIFPAPEQGETPWYPYKTWEEQVEAEDEKMEVEEWLEEEERKKMWSQTISKLLSKTAVVLESKTIHHVAMAGVINALYRAVRLEEKIPKPPLTGLNALRRKVSE